MIVLADRLRTQIAQEARAAFPRECCGLVEGLRDDGSGRVWRVTGLHPARNIAPSPDRFEIDPAAHLAAQKAARRRGHAVIGCYHSHPGGDPAPSAHDKAGAAQDDFLWLIAALDGASLPVIQAYVYSADGFAEVRLVTGADFVTSSP